MRRTEPGGTDPIEVKITKVLRMTDAGVMVSQMGKTVWLPLSQIAENDVIAVGDTDITLTIPRWLANEKSLLFKED